MILPSRKQTRYEKYHCSNEHQEVIVSDVLRVDNSDADDDGDVLLAADDDDIRFAGVTVVVVVAEVVGKVDVKGTVVAEASDDR